jgi:hypothetical protein
MWVSFRSEARIYVESRKLMDIKQILRRIDHWFGTTSLAIQLWDLYVVANEQNYYCHDLGWRNFKAFL